MQNPNLEIAEVFYRINVGAPIGDDLVAQAFELILTNPHVKARDSQLGAFLVGLMAKGPTSTEVVTLIRTALNIDGLVRYKPSLPKGELLVGVAGSGKKGCRTFNISTTACLVASAAGAYVAKPGSTATSSVSGSRDFITTVGAQILDQNEMIRVLLATRFGMFSIEGTIPKFDEVYGGKIFGPTPLSFAFPAMINPVACDVLLYGLSHPNIKLSLDVFSELGHKNVVVVASTEDKVHYVDELSTLSSNLMGTVREGVISGVKEFSPTDLTRRHSSSPEELGSGMSLVENAQVAIRVLEGKSPGPHEDTAALNAAAILVLANKVANLQDGFGMAIETIRSGNGLKKLKEFVEATGGSKKALSTIAGGDI